VIVATRWLAAGLALVGLSCGSADVRPSDPAAAPDQVPAGAAAANAPVDGAEGLMVGVASYYSDRLAGRKTASGEPYDPRALTAAHRKLPFGTVVEVARPDGRVVIVRINDRGPFARGRVVDLSRRAAETLGMMKEGVADVRLRVVQAAPPRRKKRGR
jgi:rare lipoprotein A